VNYKSAPFLCSQKIFIFTRAKYLLAVVESLLDAFRTDIGGGYNIGCQFGTTLDWSELGPLACEKNYKALVGSFHGHAHNRLCQTSFLATYVMEMGLEDLEDCECFFSKSNALASSVCYASTFHQKQKIVEFMKHMDRFEMSQNISEFLMFIMLSDASHPFTRCLPSQ